MKKTIRTIIIATALTVAIMLSCACAMPARAEKADRSEFYSKLASCEVYSESYTENIKDFFRVTEWRP